MARLIALLVMLVGTAAAAVVLAVALVPGAATAPADPGTGFEARVRAYLIAHPEVIMESVAAFQRRRGADALRRQQAALRAHAKLLRSGRGLPVAGNPEGDVTVVEFFDYRCPYCKRSAPEVRALLAADKGVRVVYKEFPVLGPPSVLASRAAIAAAKQGRYLPFHDALLAHSGGFDVATVMEIARRVGLDTDRLRRDMAAPEVDAMIEENMALADQLGITGTPTFIIGNAMAPGYVGLAGLKRLVGAARDSR